MKKQNNLKQTKMDKRLKNEYRKQNEDLPKAIICDLDGTLALINNRSPFDASKCERDLPNIPILNLVNNYKSLGYKIILLSGRDGTYEFQTKSWLQTNEVLYDALWMRKPKDYRKDSIIKEEIFIEKIEDNYYIEFVLDDRNQVVDLWRKKLKLPCLQVFYGDF